MQQRREATSWSPASSSSCSWMMLYRSKIVRLLWPVSQAAGVPTRFGESFRAYIEQILVPTLPGGSSRAWREPGAIGHPGGCGVESRGLPMGGAEAHAVTAVLATNRRASPPSAGVTVRGSAPRCHAARRPGLRSCVRPGAYGGDPARDIPPGMWLRAWPRVRRRLESRCPLPPTASKCA